MSTVYTVTAMSGGHDRTFDSLEAAREYASELLGENDSLDIHITDENGRRHLTYAQLEFVKEVSEEPAPLGLSINLQIQISPDASEEQIENIIRQIQQLAAPQEESGA